jgi:hypothetical protein
MIEALKVIFLFKKPSWDDDLRLPYIFFGIIGWLEVITMMVALFM